MSEFKLNTDVDQASGYITQVLTGPDGTNPGNPEAELMRWVVKSRDDGLERSLILLGWTPPKAWLDVRKHLPKVGLRVLINWSYGPGRIEIALFDKTIGWLNEPIGEYFEIPTHWMPLPELPK